MLVLRKYDVKLTYKNFHSYSSRLRFFICDLGNTITTTSIEGAPGHNYFPGMEPGAAGQPDIQPQSYLHDMEPGPSLEPEDCADGDQSKGEIERY